MKQMTNRLKQSHPSVDYSNSVPFLCDEIIYDILIRVPPRDLVTFRRVCKSWKVVICSRDFSTAHLKHWKSRFEVTLVQGLFPYGDFVSLDVRTKTTHQLYLRNLVHEDSVIGLDSLDGLILFRVTYNKNQLYLCNPLTQKLKLIVCVATPFHKSYSTFYKLVFDSALRKYKVMGYCYHISGEVHSFKYCVIELNGDDHQEAESLGWRYAETRFQHRFMWPFNTIFVDGLLCWLARSNENREVYIQAMDIVGEKLKEKMMLPCQPGYNNWGGCNLLKRENEEGFLYVAISQDQNERGIWFLEDWDEQIWIKRYSICNGENLGSLFHFSKRFNILFVMDTEETEEYKFIVTISGELGSCNHQGQYEDADCKGSPKFTYVPSLICWD